MNNVTHSSDAVTSAKSAERNLNPNLNQHSHREILVMMMRGADVPVSVDESFL
jgi:hypothetical protein